MTELTYTVPVVGEENKLAVPKVDTALTEIKTKFNGAIDKTNVAAEIPLVPSTAKWTAIKTYTKVEANAGVEISATRPAKLAIFATAEAAALSIGGVEVVATISTTARETYEVPAGSKWKVNSPVSVTTLIT